MQNGKAPDVDPNPQNLPGSPDRKKIKLESPTRESPPKQSEEAEDKTGERRKTRFSPVHDQTAEDYETEQNVPKEATPEKLDTNSEGNLIQNSQEDLNFNVLTIPEYGRVNFGIPDFWRLDDCKIGKSFWYDENHADHVKYFIALHNDESSHWYLTQQFTVKEQIGLQLPQTFKLTFSDILDKIRNEYKRSGKNPPRVWLDVRDFCILFNSDWDASEGNPVSKLKSIEKLVTHFSFGGRLYSDTKVKEEKLLLFILKHLKNLEYLCLQDEMIKITRSSVKLEIEHKSNKHKLNLSKLKTIRLLHSRSVFSCQFLVEMLERCPKLENIYGMPLHLLKKIDRRIKDIHKGKDVSSSSSSSSAPSCKFKSVIRSLYTNMSDYSPSFSSTYFLGDISMFRGRGKRALYEWSTRTIFISNFHIRAKCLNVMSNVLKENAATIQKLSIEPPLECKGNEMSKINFPVLEKCTTIQFHMMRQYQKAHSIFPRGFDVSKKFPNLTQFEIIIRKKFSVEEARKFPTFGSKSLWSFFDEHFPFDIFDKERSFETVKFLALHNFCPYEVMPRVAELFPNVRVLRLTSGLLDVVSVLHLCYKHWPLLEQLILEINNDTKFTNLDPAFTGVAQKAVSTIAEAIDLTSTDALSIIEKNRIKLPISHLKHLQLVKIILRSFDFCYPNAKPIFTPFSIYFGFDLKKIPKTKIQVCFCDRDSTAAKQKMLKTLEPVLPFIEVDD